MKYIERQLQSLPEMTNRELIESFRQLRYGIGLIKRNGTADDIEEMEEALETIKRELQQRNLKDRD